LGSARLSRYLEQLFVAHTALPVYRTLRVHQITRTSSTLFIAPQSNVPNSLVNAHISFLSSPVFKAHVGGFHVSFIRATCSAQKTRMMALALALSDGERILTIG